MSLKHCCTWSRAVTVFPETEATMLLMTLLMCS